ncbi:MAG: aminoacyl-tRNA hydrolase [Phycisphaerae bacterium]|nr:aminoacyl-tRNA hydrolase [Phycisphaerae bacterium]
MSDVKMIVGLGNPGKEYAGTRHSIGFEVVDALCEKLGIDVSKKKFGAKFGMGVFEDKKLILLKPWTFMNRSGVPVSAAFGFFKLEIVDVIVVSDDLALECGRIRIRDKGSAGGQKGLGDVLSKLKSNEVARVRIGIGESGVIDAADYVLGRPSAADKKILSGAVETAVEAVLWMVKYGVVEAMNKYNGLEKE